MTKSGAGGRKEGRGSPPWYWDGQMRRRIRSPTKANGRRQTPSPAQEARPARPRMSAPLVDAHPGNRAPAKPEHPPREGAGQREREYRGRRKRTKEPANAHSPTAPATSAAKAPDLAPVRCWRSVSAWVLVMRRVFHAGLKRDASRNLTGFCRDRRSRFRTSLADARARGMGANHAQSDLARGCRIQPGPEMLGAVHDRKPQRHRRNLRDVSHER